MADRKEYRNEIHFAADHQEDMLRHLATLHFDMLDQFLNTLDQHTRQEAARYIRSKPGA